jgi:hypothetical protein
LELLLAWFSGSAVVKQAQPSCKTFNLFLLRTCLDKRSLLLYLQMFPLKEALLRTTLRLL